MYYFCARVGLPLSVYAILKTLMETLKIKHFWVFLWLSWKSWHIGDETKIIKLIFHN